jgi:hypothetical protein
MRGSAPAPGTLPREHHGKHRTRSPCPSVDLPAVVPLVDHRCRACDCRHRGSGQGIGPPGDRPHHHWTPRGTGWGEHLRLAQEGPRRTPLGAAGLTVENPRCSRGVASERALSSSSKSPGSPRCGTDDLGHPPKVHGLSGSAAWRVASLRSVLPALEGRTAQALSNRSKKDRYRCRATLRSSVETSAPCSHCDSREVRSSENV